MIFGLVSRYGFTMHSLLYCVDVRSRYLITYRVSFDDYIYFAQPESAALSDLLTVCIYLFSFLHSFKDRRLGLILLTHEHGEITSSLHLSCLLFVMTRFEYLGSLDFIIAIKYQYSALLNSAFLLAFLSSMPLIYHREKEIEI